MEKEVHNTGDSQVVTHPCTNPAQCYVTLVIRQKLMLSM